MVQKFVRRILAFLILATFISKVNAQEACLKVDLQAVSISPVLTSLEPGKQTQLEVVMRNNGPCEIPKGEATAQITINTDHLEITGDLQFSDDCGNWTFLTATTSGNLKNLFFRNNGGALPVGGKICAFHFNVKAKSKSPGTSTITLASSLSASAKTADMNGNNQSAYTEVIIKGNKAEPKLPPVKENKPLVKLDAKADDCTAVLKWETPAAESFDIETSTDKTNFSSIGTLAKNTDNSVEYKYETYQGNARKYYRVKITNTDGTTEYSSIVELETKCKVKKGF
jgi:hypothetical protein